MHRGPGLESAESLPASGATPGNLGNKEPTVTWPVPPWSRDTAHLGWVQLHSCLSSRGPQKKNLSHPVSWRWEGRLGKLSLAWAAMKFLQATVRCPGFVSFGVSSHNPAGLWVVTLALCTCSGPQEVLQKQPMPACYMEAEGESLAEVFLGAVIERARGGPAEDEGCGVPGHRAAAALAHRHISWLMSARDKQVDDRKHYLPAGDMSALHLPVTHASTRE